ncbi:MAG: hypothetical protein AB2L24_21910 [Mangrovibacterium sp.]
MKKLIVFLLSLLIAATTFSQTRTATIATSVSLTTDSLFIWKNDTIQKNSLVYIDFSITGDSIRFKLINDSAQWSNWLYQEDFGIRLLAKNRVPYKGDSTLLDSPISVVDNKIGIGTTNPLVKLHVAGDAGIEGSAVILSTLDVGGQLNVSQTGTFASNIVQNSGSIGTNHFISQTRGWRGLYDGTWDMQLLYTNELRAKAFTADVAQALAGSDFLTKSVSKLNTNFVIPNTGLSARMIVDDLEGFPGLRVFANGDYIRHRVFDRRGGGLTIADAWGTVALDITYGSNGFLNGTQAYTFTTVNALPAIGLTVYKGAEVLDYGKATDNTNGVMERTVLDPQGSPYSQVKTWVTNPYTPGNYTIHTREGNLNGIQNASGYGFYGSNTFLTNKLLAGDLTKSNQYMEYANGVLTVKGVINVLGGNAATTSDVAVAATTATWSGITSKPSYLQTPTGSGLFISADHMGYYSSGTWKTYMDNAGNMVLGNISGGGPGLMWDQANGLLGIIGEVMITTGYGYSNFTDKPTSLSQINSSEGSKLSGIQAGATNGATWGTNLNNIPGRLAETAPNNSLAFTNTFLGFHATGSNWPVMIANDNGVGKFYAGNGTNYVDWNGSTLTVQGALRATTGYFGNATTGWNIGSSYLYNDSYTAGMSPTDFPFYAGATYANRATAPFRITSAGVLSASGVNISGTIDVEGGSIGDFTISGGELYWGAFPRDNNSITIGKTGSGELRGAIDLRGPSGGTTNNLLYIQGGNIQHQNGEFLAANVRLRGTTNFPSGSTIDIDEGVSFEGVYRGETNGRISILRRTTSGTLTLNDTHCYINYTSTGTLTCNLPTTEVGGRRVGKVYYFRRLPPAGDIQVVSNTSNISVGTGTSSSFGMQEANWTWMVVWDGTNWLASHMDR